MKTSTWIFASALLLATPALGAIQPATGLTRGLSSPAGTTGSASVVSPLLRPALELTSEEFLKEFRAALEIQARSEMKRLVQKNKETAVGVIIDLCEAIAIGPKPETRERLEIEMEGMRNAWEDATNTRFAQNIYEYFSFISNSTRATRSQLRERYRKADIKRLQFGEERNWSSLDAICDEFAAVAKGFTSVGDHYFASQSWFCVGVSVDYGLRGNEADLERAREAFENSWRSREKVDLKDPSYDRAKARAAELKTGSSRPAAGPDAGGSDQPDAGESSEYVKHLPGASLKAAEVLKMNFEMVLDLEAYERPHYSALDLPIVWNSVYLQGRGSKIDFPAMGDEGPELVRVGSADLAVDINRDGTMDKEIPMTGNTEPIQFTMGSGDSERSWGFLCRILTAREFYQGIEINLEPQDQGFSLYLAPAASMVGLLGETQLRVIDENLDGTYGSGAREWSWTGFTEGFSQPELDSLVIGESDRALPFSEYVNIEDMWYQLLSDKGGTELHVSEATVKTGKLKVNFKGGSPTYLVVRGTGTFEYSYFDVMAAGKKGIEVPTGDYLLYYGELRKGKREQMMKALIVAGKDEQRWSVTEGKTTTIELGGPFNFDFEHSSKGEMVTLKGNSVAVVGRGGERYERLWNCPSKPEVEYRKVGSKRSSKGGKTKHVLDQFGIIEKGYASAWHPLDLEFSKKDADEAVELMLFEKKHKLFGKVSSPWK